MNAFERTFITKDIALIEVNRLSEGREYLHVETYSDSGCPPVVYGHILCLNRLQTDPQWGSLETEYIKPTKEEVLWIK